VETFRFSEQFPVFAQKIAGRQPETRFPDTKVAVALTVSLVNKGW
jgi:hypothetical protein